MKLVTYVTHCPFHPLLGLNMVYKIAVDGANINFVWKILDKLTLVMFLHPLKGFKGSLIRYVDNRHSRAINN